MTTARRAWSAFALQELQERPFDQKSETENCLPSWPIGSYLILGIRQCRDAIGHLLVSQELRAR